MNNVKAISLFSGAGGDTLGMIKAGINVVGYVEIDENAIDTHEKNFKNCRLIGTDITKIPDEVFEKFKGGIDIIFGGFPCQSFSHGGKKKATDKRGFLFEEFVRCAKIIKPAVIIGENVKGLLSRKMTDKTLFIDKIVSDFTSIGYNMKISVFNMKNYGIPQDRERILIYGTKKDSSLSFNLNNLQQNEKVYLRDILQLSLHNSLEIKKENIKKLFPPDCLILTEEYKQTGKPPTNLVKCVDKDEISFKKRSKSTYSCIVDKNDFSRTILSTYGRMPRLFVSFIKNEKFFLRPYTIRELALIQGFPEDFVFSGNDLQKTTQIGNAIPPLFVEKITRYILGIMKGDIIEI